MKTRRLASLLIALLSIVCTTGAFAAGHPLLIISIDGLPPRYVANADSLGLRIPNLRSFVREGVHALGVTGVVPTLTYPSHTTILTGVTPAEHGISSNVPFDPLQSNYDGWYWYTQNIRVPTLWSAAHDAGLRTASVNWPVTVRDRNIDTLLPEYWHESKSGDINLLRTLARPQKRMVELERKLGHYVDGNTETLESDAIRTRFTVELLKTEKPQLLAVHLIALDGTEHHDGPDTPAAYAVLESLDAMVGTLTAAAIAAQRDTVVAIVSDHGFIASHTAVNLRARFVGEGLITLADGTGHDDDARVASWDAQAWTGGASAAVVLRDPNDASLRQRVGLLLQTLAAEPVNGIAHVLDAAAITASGGFPEAAFVVEFAPGFYFGTALRGPLLTPAYAKGMHGYLPYRPEMHAVFYMKGPGVPAGRDLGVIDMRQIAPTFAEVLHVDLPSAKQAAVIDLIPDTQLAMSALDLDK